MKMLLTTLIIISVCGVVVFVAFYYMSASNAENTIRAPQGRDDASQQSAISMKTNANNASPRNAEIMVAGGCFWCVEADLEKLDAVSEVISGYSGGESKNPTYGDYASGGHREVALVKYNPEKITLYGLLYYFVKHIDPTDGGGQFSDRGEQYAPAIYYANQTEKETAERVLSDIADTGVYEGELQVPVLSGRTFWRAEEYHQDYYKNHPVKYGFYRRASGRSGFIEDHWGKDADDVPADPNDVSHEQAAGPAWEQFTKPSDEVLRQKLTDMQYHVTQEEGTEPAYKNEYWDETRDGIYVDVVSGEPLFSSENKYKSGTGWPSFTKPLEPDNIVLKDDWRLFFKRTEVRSKYGDSHLGHVFDDGPTTIEASGGAEPTGKRYCLNSAALRFVPKEQLEEEGYGAYASQFD